MKNTKKTVAIKQPRNYWISRTVWEDERGLEWVKLNGNPVMIDFLICAGWVVKYIY